MGTPGIWGDREEVGQLGAGSQAPGHPIPSSFSPRPSQPGLLLQEAFPHHGSWRVPATALSSSLCVGSSPPFLSIPGTPPLNLSFSCEDRRLAGKSGPFPGKGPALLPWMAMAMAPPAPRLGNSLLPADPPGSPTLSPSSIPPHGPHGSEGRSWEKPHTFFLRRSDSAS